ncbi:MAG TPA: plastocyanin/azurin family copper-binding protein [Terriglobia bacterium]
MKSLRFFVPVLAAVLLVAAPALDAQKTWYANVGAETKDQGVQADGFFPNELWIFAGDSIQWTFAPKNEIHTVTFLMPNQVRPLATPPVGPPAGTPVVGLPLACGPYTTPQSYTGSNCVSTNPVSGGTTFTVTFPNPGNFKLVCLVHTDMNGTVHVLANNNQNAALLQTQKFYDDQARDQSNDLLKDQDDQHELKDVPGNQVAAGIGEIVGTGGGTQYRAVVRFLQPTITIHKGESVTWTNLDPTEPHTVTFGAEPNGFNPTVPVDLGSPLGDGTLTGVITSTGDFLNSGFLQTQAPDRPAPGLGTPPTGDIQLPPGQTRITITFNKPGTYQYHCALHDVDGMVGKVIVTP